MGMGMVRWYFLAYDIACVRLGKETRNTIDTLRGMRVRRCQCCDIEMSKVARPLGTRSSARQVKGFEQDVRLEVSSYFLGYSKLWHSDCHILSHTATVTGQHRPYPVLYSIPKPNVRNKQHQRNPRGAPRNQPSPRYPKPLHTPTTRAISLPSARPPARPPPSFCPAPPPC